MAGLPNEEREIFSAALERGTPAERAAFLDGACGDDAELRARVGELLSAHELAGGFLRVEDSGQGGSELDATRGSDWAALPVFEKPGDRIGRHKILEKIGEGGGGVVYVAEQEQPVRRRVALKIIKLGMDTKAVVARFDAERQALAMMEHPNIAKVFEAGATETGRPYFVMELVRGIKITDYCDQNQLSTRQRLELFIRVCQAAQHAHQKGIIHRDIKPSNVLVTLHDGVPVPKIIDFGIAKATQGRLTDLTVYTDLHQFIGTPAYMSPEQAEMSGLDIDTRSDIYSLGVLLYELLTGQTPFDARALMQSGLDAMRKTIRETEPLRPSTRLHAMVASELTMIANRHSAQPPRLINLVRGDLDWIVMKSLEKDRRRRYETANALALEVQRHLDNEPIVARPQSFAYRCQKLVRRNKLSFASAGAVAVALLFGLAGIIWQWRQSEQNHLEAEANLYAADMNRSAQVLEDFGPVAARGLLQRHTGQTQLHGFEWRYLWKRCLGDSLFSFPSHGNPIWKLVYSPDGKTLAALEKGGGLRVLNVKERSERTGLTNVTGLGGFTADGKQMVLIVRKGNGLRLILFDPSTGGSSELMETKARFGWLPDLLADGQTALIPGKGTDIALVDIATRTVTRRLSLPFNGFLRWEAFAEACAVSHDGKFVCCLDNGSDVGTAGILSVREMDSGRILATYRDDTPETPRNNISDRAYTLRFLDDKTVLWANRDGYVRRWRWADAASPPLAENGHRGIIWAFDISPDGRCFATAGDDQTVRLWDADKLRVTRVLRGHENGVFSVAFSPDGKWLASGGSDGTIKLSNLENGGASGNAAVVAARQLGNRIIFSRDGRSLAIGTDDNGIRVLNSDSGQVMTTFPELIFPARFSANAARIYGLGGIGNLVNGKVQTNAITEFGYPWVQDVSPDGNLMFRSFRSGVAKKDIVELFDVQRDLAITNFAHSIFAARFTQDGHTLLTCDEHGLLVSWTVTPTAMWPRQSAKLGHYSRALALSSDSRTAALGGPSQITLLDYQSGNVRQRLFGHAREITGLAFAPDGATLASCSMDGTIKLWNLHTMQEVCTLPFDVKPALGKEIGVQTVAFAPDGNSLWACSRSGALKYWRAMPVEEIPTVEQGSLP